MAKFVIECPNCGRYAQARTGFFAKKKIECSCGYVIDVKTDRMSTRICPHCGNTFVYDAAKGTDVKCPVCHQNVMASQKDAKLIECTCAQCGVHFQTSQNAETFTCPVCDFVNDVQERVVTEKIKNSELASIIKYEGDNETLVWKHPVEDFNMGSQLIVHESQEAIFFRDGQALDLFGAGRYTLETQQLPLLKKLYQLPTDTEGTFHSEIYFINTATQMGIKWGTDSKVRLFDPVTGMHIEIGASGEFNVRVIDSRKLLLKIVGTTSGLKQEQLLGNNGKSLFRSMVMTNVKSYLAATIRERQLNILEIDEHLMELSEALKMLINPKLEEYGLTMPEFYVIRVVTPDDDPDFVRMKKQFAEQYLDVRQEQIRKNVAMAAAERQTVEAQTEARMKIIGAQGDAEALKVQKSAEAEAYRMQAAAEADEMKMKGYTYQQETARKVGLGATLAMGQMGASGSGLGEIASLGVTLGAMSGVAGLTKDALNSTISAGSDLGQGIAAAMSPAVSSTWDCAGCGQKNITSKFCPNCGAKKPEPKQEDFWTCTACGATGLSTKFCPECGAKRPDAVIGWMCPNCGKKNILSKFCPECGFKKPELKPLTWDCPVCGAKCINGKFCPECGNKRGE